MADKNTPEELTELLNKAMTKKVPDTCFLNSTNKSLRAFHISTMVVANLKEGFIDVESFVHMMCEALRDWTNEGE